MVRVIPFGEFMDFSETNNPTIDKLVSTYKTLEMLGMINDDLRKEASVLAVMQKFNELFKNEAWVLNDYLPVDYCLEAVTFAENGNYDEANNVLIDAVTAGIDLFFSHLNSAKEFEQRRATLENAKELYLQSNHSATIPLLLIALDGISNDITNLGLFAQNSNLTVWDSISQYDDAFTYLQKNFLTKSRTKTNLEEIYLPYRNGILHGRDVNFANSHVSAKCWNILFTLRTWYRDKKDESYKKKKVEAEADQKIKNDVFEHFLCKFEERRRKAELTDDSGAVDMATTFFDSWKQGQWGKIVPLMYHLVGKQKGIAAREVKDTYEPYKLVEYKIHSFSHDTPSSACVGVDLKVLIHGELVDFPIVLRLNFSCSELLPIPIEHPDGKWGIVQNSLSAILFKQV